MPEILEVSTVASVAGLLHDGRLTERRPFRSPHHATSVAAMVGGGPHARPGEVSLAHKGVLFLDELPEFHRSVLESLRQPLEVGHITVARANHHVTYPARCQLVAAMNPCRCGNAGEPGHACRRGPRCAADYQARISGPLLDRIDIRIEVPALAASDLIRPGASETSAEVAERVAAARGIQTERFRALGASKVRCNAQAGADLIETVAAPERAGVRLLEDAAAAMQLTARGYHRVLKLARTLADLDGAETVARIHVAEALSYRTLPAELQMAA
jgi:magnesium chelatase family protein